MSCHHLDGLTRHRCLNPRCRLAFLYCPHCMLTDAFCPDCAHEGIAHLARDASRRARHLSESRLTNRRYYALHRDHIRERRKQQRAMKRSSSNADQA